MKPSIISRIGVSTRSTCNCEYNGTQGICDHKTTGETEANNNNIIYSLDDLDTPSDDSDLSSKMLDQASSDIDSDSISLPSGHELDEDHEKCNLSTIYQGEWPINKTYWTEDAESSACSSMDAVMQQDTRSIMSFDSSMTCSSVTNHASTAPEPPSGRPDLMLGTNLLSMLQSHDKTEVVRMLLEMSTSPENCIAMLEPGSQCLPLLVELIHDRSEKPTFMAYRQSIRLRATANQILHNIIFSQPDDKKGRREMRVLRLLEQVRSYCDYLQNCGYEVNDNKNEKCTEQQLGPTVAALMKLSFDEEHRHAMCQLGGLQALAELIEIDQEIHGCTGDQYCTMIRRYSGMALTNLTFGDGANKALLCSMKPFMLALVAQLHSPSEELRQVSASVLRNLSWRADKPSKKMLREVGAVTTLMKAAMEATKESTLKSILSALWNLSAHCSENKADICHMDGALGFLVNTLSYKSGTKNLAVVENCGGILRNISSHIAIQNDLRAILRKHNCLQILLHHLKSPSLTVVSNACGTLWNLSARNAQDQRALWEMGAVSMLKKLMNSKHKMISMGSSAALKNLLSAMPPNLDGSMSAVTSDYNSGMPSLHVRKQKILNAEIDQNLSETFDNTDSSISSPTSHPRSRKSNVSRGRHSSLPRHGIPQRIEVKKRNVSETRVDSSPEKVMNILDDSVNRSPAHEMHDVKPLSAKQSPVAGREIIRPKGSFATQKYTNHRNIPCPPNNSINEPVMRVASPGNMRPYSFPSRIEKPRFKSSSPPPVSSKTTSCRAIPNQVRTVPQPQIFRQSGDKNYYNNLSQKMKNVEDASYQEHPVNYSLKYSEETLSASNTSLNEGTSGSAKSKIPLPKFNNYVEDERDASMNDSAQESCRKIVQRTQSQIFKMASADGASYGSQKSLDQRYQDDQTKVDAPFYEKDRFSFRHGHSGRIKAKAESPESISSSSSSLNELQGIASFGAQSQVQALSKMYEVSPQNFNRDDTGTVPRNTADKNSDFMQKRVKLRSRKENAMETRNAYATRRADVDEEVNHVQTPLVFSRSSSLGSLGSFEQQQNHEYSSPVSEFSQQTSDIASPSELPDSPSETMLQSSEKARQSPSHQKSKEIRNDIGRAPRRMEQRAGTRFHDTKSNLPHGAGTAMDHGSLKRGELYQQTPAFLRKDSPKKTTQQNRKSWHDDHNQSTETKPDVDMETDEQQVCSNTDGPKYPRYSLQYTSRHIKPPKDYKKAVISKIPMKPGQALDTEEPIRAEAHTAYAEDTEGRNTSSPHRDQSKLINIVSQVSPYSGECVLKNDSRVNPQNATNIYAGNVPNKLEKQGFTKTNLGNETDTLSTLRKQSSKEDDITGSHNSANVFSVDEKEAETEDGSDTENKKTKPEIQRSHIPNIRSGKDLPSKLPTFSPKKQVPLVKSMQYKYGGAKDFGVLKKSDSAEKCIDSTPEPKPDRTELHHKAEEEVSRSTSEAENASKISSRIADKHVKKNPSCLDSPDELSDADKALLEECIQLGMPKKDEYARKNIPAIPIATRDKAHAGNSEPKKTGSLERNNQSRIPQPQDAAEVDETKSEELQKVDATQSAVKDVATRDKDSRTNNHSQSSLSPHKQKTSSKNEPSVQNSDEHNGLLDTGLEDTEVKNTSDSLEKDETFVASLPPEICVEAQKLADDMLEAAVDSTEDMTVSTLSCLSEIDNMQPPSVMAELECLSLNGYSSDAEQPKISKVQCSPSKQNSLLKRLQISRLSRDQQDLLSKSRMSGSTGSLNMDSSGTSEILENINPPSMLDDMSFTASTGSLNSLPSNILDSRSDDNVVMYASDDSSMNERLCEAAAMVQMYAKEFSNITGNNLNAANVPSGITSVQKPSVVQAVAEGLDDVTDHCDTIASDAEFADDLPCDDEDLGSETLLAPQLSSLSKEEPGEGSTENLTVTLTEEPPKKESKQNEEDDESEDLADADQYKALRENADLILNSLKRVHLSENSEFGGLPANDMLEDETLSLVSNDSDEDSLSPDGVFQ